jgi:RecA/RadA recombinase
MARKKQEKQEALESHEEISHSDPSSLLGIFLKNNKASHYNFEEEINYKVSSGSLLMDFELGGGFGPGLHRFCGANECGKTSCALSVMKNFLDEPEGRRGVYLKAEGRLSLEIKERSGINFVGSEEEWKDGTCFVFDSNIYETVVDLMRVLVADKSSGKKYFFILDSVDGLITKGDNEKALDESAKVAGGAVIASTLMKKISIALAKRGHIAIFISQVRADIKLDPYSKAPIRQTSATGGNALLHFSNWILEFETRFKGDLILEDPKNSPDPRTNKILGHFAKATVKKSPNEKTNIQIRYPIRYGRKNGNSIWNEKEILDLLYIWNFAEKKGAWITFSEDFIKEFSEKSVIIPGNIQGEPKFNQWLEDNESYKKIFISYFMDLI